MYKIILALGLLAAQACSHPVQVDRACDMLVFDSASSRTVVRSRLGSVIDSNLTRQAEGQLFVRAFTLPDSVMIATVHLQVRTAAGDTVPTTGSSGSGIRMSGKAGAYELWPRCIACAKALVSHEIVVGRLDTLDFYLGQARSSCTAPPH